MIAKIDKKSSTTSLFFPSDTYNLSLNDATSLFLTLNVSNPKLNIFKIQQEYEKMGFSPNKSEILKQVNSEISRLTKLDFGSISSNTDKILNLDGAIILQKLIENQLGLAWPGQQKKYSSNYLFTNLPYI